MHTRMATFYMNNDHEGALGGLNELEIFGQINGSYNDCAYYTGIYYQTNYYWNPDSYLNTVATAIPLTGYNMVLSAYEDDSGACVVNGADDYMGSATLPITQYNFEHLTTEDLDPNHESSGDLVFMVRVGNP